MAQKVQILFIDDLDGSTAEGTVFFELDGSQYEIDLNKGHTGELRATLARYIAVARKVPGSARRPPQGRRRPAADSTTNADMRALGQCSRHRDQRPRPYPGGCDRPVLGSHKQVTHILKGSGVRPPLISPTLVPPSPRSLNSCGATLPVLRMSARPDPRRRGTQRRSAAVVIKKITGVGVASSRRGSGIGRALTRAAAGLAWRTGCRLIYGQFPVGSNLNGFFTSCGFDILHPAEISLVPYGLPAGIIPEPGNQFFARYYDEGVCLKDRAGGRSPR